MDFSPSEMRALLRAEPELQPHQTRVITESQELATLQAFIKSDRFSSVEIAEQNRLLRQELIMIDYLAVLNERIAAFNV